MRSRILFSLLLTSLSALAQATDLRINELQAANSTLVLPGSSATPDWIELYNPGRKTVQLQGMRLLMNGDQHRFEQPLSIAPGELLLLWCDGQPKLGPTHVAFTLPKSGGTLLLMDAFGTSLVDAFTWKELPSGVSMARMPDGASTWGYATEPSPGAANPQHALRTKRLQKPSITVEELADNALRVSIHAQEGSTLRYSTDGTPPTEHSGTEYQGPVELPAGGLLRYAAFAADALPSDEGLLSVPHRTHRVAVTHIALPPNALHGDSSGIDTPGLFANHTRSGAEWERRALAQYDGGDAVPLGLRVSGSGSRGLAKRSFKLYYRDRYDSPKQGFTFPDGTQFREAILRADASPHAFLRNQLIEVLVQRHGLALDLQPSTPTALYINGQYRGLYRLMPPKDVQWAKTVSGAEAVDLLAGPAHVARSGSAAHFLRSKEALLRGAPLDSLNALMDLNSLVDLACVDLWTGRADHDINVRCYRPRQAGGRWRWILYDMDLWSPVEMNSVDAFCAETMPEAPYLPQLLAQPQLQQLLLARMTTLQATAFAPAQASALADSLYLAQQDELLRDHARWALELDPPTPEEVRQSMRRFITERPKHHMRHLAEHCGRQLQSITIEVPPAHMGSLRLNGSALPPGKQEILCFSGIEMELEAIPSEGQEFAGWRGLASSETKISTDLSQQGRIKVMFRSLEL